MRVGRLEEQDRVGFGRGAAQVDHRHVELLAQRAGQRVFVDDAAFDERLAEPLAIGVRRDELERIARHDPRVHQQVAEADPWFGHREIGYQLCGRLYVRDLAALAQPHDVTPAAPLPGQ